MSVLDGFELVENVSGIPSMSITKNGISFNKPVIEKMKKQRYIQTYIDRIEKRMAIVGCEQNDNGAREFYKEGRDTAYGVRWNNFDLRTTITKMMDWDLESTGWKIPGEYIEDEGILLFNFKSARPLCSRSR